MNDDSRTMGMLAHLSALLGGMVGGVGSWVGPLIVWLVKKDNDPFAAEHAKEALNFNLTITLIMVVGFVLGFVLTIVTFGIGLFILVPAAIVIGVLWLIWTIQAAVKANNGEAYRYPLTIRFIS